VETFTGPKRFVESTRYSEDRNDVIEALNLASIDEPIRDIVSGFAALPHCFPLQSCYGHFVCRPDQNIHTLEPIPAGHSGPVRYRIAYLALCLENSGRGLRLQQSLARLPLVDPDYIQFGCADWFWERWVNTYALQVEPRAHMTKDEAVLECGEARRTQRARDRFFRELRMVLASESQNPEGG
jgi:hypothetical protein